MLSPDLAYQLLGLSSIRNQEFDYSEKDKKKYKRECEIFALFLSLFTILGPRVALDFIMIQLTHLTKETKKKEKKKPTTTLLRPHPSRTGDENPVHSFIDAFRHRPPTCTAFQIFHILSMNSFIATITTLTEWPKPPPLFILYFTPCMTLDLNFIFLSTGQPRQTQDPWYR